MSRAPLAYESAVIANVPPARKSRVRYLVWAVGILVVGGMLISVMLPSLCRSSETANRVKCGSNLRQIGQAISLYAQSNGGQYPPSLAVLLSAEDITAEVMICASSNDEKAAGADMKGVEAELAAAEANSPGHKHCLSYVYVGKGLTEKTASERTIVAYEPLENHDGQGVNVLFGDGHVEFFSKAEWVKMAADAGIAVAPMKKR
jgi:prepilin-type processing-associated H-X9-DG protein